MSTRFECLDADRCELRHHVTALTLVVRNFFVAIMNRNIDEPFADMERAFLHVIAVLI